MTLLMSGIGTVVRALCPVGWGYEKEARPPQRNAGRRGFGGFDRFTLTNPKGHQGFKRWGSLNALPSIHRTRRPEATKHQII
jgi:hypothetical protein